MYMYYPFKKQSCIFLPLSKFLIVCKGQQMNL